MPTTAITLATLIQQLAASFDDMRPRSGVATATGGSTTTVTVAGELGTLPAGYLIGAEIRFWSGTAIGQTLIITAHTVSSGTATLTFPTATAPVANDTFTVQHVGGRGYTYNQYLQAVNAAIDNAAEHRFGTDVSGVPFAIELAGGAVTQMETRLDYPMPSGYQWLHEIDVLSRGPLVVHSHDHLNTIRA